MENLNQLRFEIPLLSHPTVWMVYSFITSVRFHSKSAMMRWYDAAEHRLLLKKNWIVWEVIIVKYAWAIIFVSFKLTPSELNYTLVYSNKLHKGCQLWTLIKISAELLSIKVMMAMKYWCHHTCILSSAHVLCMECFQNVLWCCFVSYITYFVPQ